MKKAYVILAEGFELIEAMTPVDVLKRCEVEVETVSITGGFDVASSQGVVVRANKLFKAEELGDGDMLILPGGYPGYENIAGHKGVMELAKYYLHENRYLAAICGAPLALAKAGLLTGRKVTSHFTVREALKGGEFIEESVVVDGKLITSTGAGRSLEFSLVLGGILTSEEVLKKVKKGMTLI